MAIGALCSAYDPNSVAASIAVFMITSLFLFLGTYNTKGTEPPFLMMFFFSIMSVPIQCILIRMLGDWEGHVYLSIIGTVFYATYVTYDISEMLQTISIDDYIMGSLRLYSDTLKVFIHIIEFIGELKKD